MRTLAVLSVATLLLAGCSSSADSPEPTTDFDDLDLAPTATTGVIRGVVVDEAIRPLANASITLTPGDKTTRSNANGLFGFSGLEPGTYFLRVEKFGYDDTQTSTEVVAGLVEPPIVKILLTANPSATPYVEALSFNGFLSLGVAVIATSIGTTILALTAETLGDASIWTVNFTVEPKWLQGELVWEHNQAAGGMLIWEITRAGSNNPAGYRETAESPALAYWNDETIAEHNQTNWPDHPNYSENYDLLEDGVSYRFFGGPHPLCTGVFFGCGLTVQQRADAYVHQFYNFVPDEGWRFTVHGDPVVPQ